MIAQISIDFVKDYKTNTQRHEVFWKAEKDGKFYGNRIIICDDNEDTLKQGLHLMIDNMFATMKEVKNGATEMS